MRDPSLFTEEFLEAMSLLPPEDPVRLGFEADMAHADVAIRSRYQQLLKEAVAFRHALQVSLPAGLTEQLLEIPARARVRRHSRFLTRFRAAAAAAIVLMLLAPATAWFLPAGGYERIEKLPAAAAAAVNSPLQVPGTQPSNLGETFANSPLPFFAILPQPKKGTQFLGGGLTTLVGKPAAFGRYRADHHNFTLFFISVNDFPLFGDGQLPMAMTPEGDESLCYWTDGPCVGIMVSEPGGASEPSQVVDMRPLRFNR